MMKEEKIKINFGCLAEPISHQLRGQGGEGNSVQLKDKTLDKVPRTIHSLVFHDIITPTQADKMFSKLFKKIMKNIEIVPLSIIETNDD